MPGTADVGRIRATIGLDAQPYVREIAKVKTENADVRRNLSALNKEARAADRAWRQGGDGAAEAREDLDRLNREIEEQNELLAANQVRLRAANRGLRNLEQAADRSRSGLASAGAGVTALGAGIAGLAGSAVVSGLRNVTQQISEMAESAARLEQQAAGVGVATDEFQRMQAIYAQFGLEGDDVNDVLNEISVRLVDAADGTQSTITAFERLGIPIRDASGEVRRNIDVWNDLINVVQEGASPEQANALDAILGGDIARRTAPLLQRTREEYEALVREASNAITPTETLSRLSAQHTENVEAAARQQALLNQLAVALEPIIDQWNDGMTRTLRLATQIADFVGLDLGFREGSDEARQYNIQIERIRETLQQTPDARQGFLAVLAQQGLDTEEAFSSLQERLLRIQRLGVAQEGPERDADLNALARWASLQGDLNERLREYQQVATDAAAIPTPIQTPDLSGFQAEVATIFRDTNRLAEDTVQQIDEVGLALARIRAARLGPVLTPEDFFSEEGVRERIQQVAADAAEGVPGIFDFTPEQYEELLRRQREAAAQTREAWSNVGTEVAGIFEGVFTATDRWQAVLENVLQLVLQIATNLIGGGSIGSFFGFENRQIGGPVRSNRGYIVGERGPELFVPNSSGRILSEVPDTSSQNITIVLGPEGETDAARDSWLRRRLPEIQRALNPGSILDG